MRHFDEAIAIVRGTSIPTQHQQQQQQQKTGERDWTELLAEQCAVPVKPLVDLTVLPDGSN